MWAVCVVCVHIMMFESSFNKSFQIYWVGVPDQKLYIVQSWLQFYPSPLMWTVLYLLCILWIVQVHIGIAIANVWMGVSVADAYLWLCKGWECFFLFFSILSIEREWETNLSMYHESWIWMYKYSIYWTVNRQIHTQSFMNGELGFMLLNHLSLDFPVLLLLSTNSLLNFEVKPSLFPSFRTRSRYALERTLHISSLYVY